MRETLLEIKDLKKIYPLRLSGRGWFGKKERMCAVDHLSMTIEKGETYGLVGESGCGKSTTGRAIVGLSPADSGSILYEGKDLCKMKEREMRSLRGELQMVFQNSLSALNPRLRIGEILEEILKIHGVTEKAKRKEQVLAMLEKVGLSEEHFFRFPHELSGGQVQRLGIAGALLTHPKLIVCDEPVSALDVSIQAQILNMLMRLKMELGLSLLFISHDIGVIRFISDRIGVMYLGTLVRKPVRKRCLNIRCILIQRRCWRPSRILISREKTFRCYQENNRSVQRISKDVLFIAGVRMQRRSVKKKLRYSGK